MTKILNRLPISDERSTPRFGDKYITIHRNQILIWISVDVFESHEPAENLPRIPAILDTGNNFEFSIQHRHLQEWAGIECAHLPFLGHMHHAGGDIGRHEAIVWIYRNLPGQREIDNEMSPYRLEPKKGIAVYPEEASKVTPRLPLLGLPALLNNNLDLWIDSERRQVNLHTRGWAKGIIRFLTRIST